MKPAHVHMEHIMTNNLLYFRLEVIRQMCKRNTSPKRSFHSEWHRPYKIFSSVRISTRLNFHCFSEYSLDDPVMIVYIAFPQLTYFPTIYALKKQHNSMKEWRMSTIVTTMTATTTATKLTALNGNKKMFSFKVLRFFLLKFKHIQRIEVTTSRRTLNERNNGEYKCIQRKTFKGGASKIIS